MTYLPFLESVLKQAGDLAMTFPRGMPARIKEEDPNQVVTAADTAVGSWLIRRIRAEFPQDALVDEEAGALPGTSPVTWIIDPIDGTSNFAAGSPLFGVMVGVLERGEPVAGGVSLPAFAETYVAERGKGAFCNGSRLRIDAGGDLARQLVAYGMDIHPAELALDGRILTDIAARCGGIRMSNCVFDCMMVARGVYGGFMHRRNAIWDCVAPHVIIEESGGVFSAMDGRALDYRDPLTRTSEVFSLLACGPGFHEAMTAVIRGGSIDRAGFC